MSCLNVAPLPLKIQVTSEHLDGMRVARLAENLKQGGIRHEEKARENQTLSFQVAVGVKYYKKFK